MASLKIGLKDITTANLIGKTYKLIHHLNGNVDFPNPEPSVAFLEKKLAEVEKWNLSGLDKSRLSVIHRKNAEAELKDAIKHLANYVSNNANGDALTIIQSGFELRRKAKSVSEVKIPQQLIARLGRLSGEIDLRWKSVLKGLMYVIERAEITSENTVTDWVKVGYTRKSKFKITGLEPGSRHKFRIMAIGADIESDYSQEVYSMVA